MKIRGILYNEIRLQFLKWLPFFLRYLQDGVLVL